MLAGIVVSNAILLVDYTNIAAAPRRDAAARGGRDWPAARGCGPILMTSIATMLGLVPMALGIGEGGELQAPLARVVIGGLLTSTLITLVFVPTVYTLFEEGWKGLVAARSTRRPPRIATSSALDIDEKAASSRSSCSRVVGGWPACGYYHYRKTGRSRRSRRAPVTRGDIVETVGATGTLQAVTTVQVGTQVSGTIQDALRRLQLDREEGPGHRAARPVAAPDADRAGTRQPRSAPQADLERLKRRARRRAAEARRAPRSWPRRKLVAADRPRGGRRWPSRVGRGADQVVRGAASRRRRPSLNQNEVNLDHTVIDGADRRHRHLAQRRRRARPWRPA